METTYYTVPNPYAIRRKIHAALKMAEKKRRVQKRMNQVAAVLLTVSISTCICTGFTVINNMREIQNVEVEYKQQTTMTKQENTAAEKIKDTKKEISSNIGSAIEVVKEAVKEQAQAAEEKINDLFIIEQAPLDEECRQALLEVSAERNVDPRLIIGMIEYESGFDPNIVSAKGCYGYMQLNPKYFPANLSPADNIREGVKHLANQVEKYNGDIPAALRAYNLGSDDGDRKYSNTVLQKARDHWEYPG